jgi:hypothetical protein
MKSKIVAAITVILLVFSCSKSSGDTAATDSTTTTPKTILQGSLYFPGKQSAKNIRIYLDNNTNPFDGASTTLSDTTSNTVSQAYSFDTLTVSGNFYLSAWVDVDNSGTLNAGDYFGWYRGGSNQPGSTNYSITSATTNTANVVLSTYASTTGTTATATINLPSASTGKDLYVVLDADQDLSNGWVGGTHVRTDGNTSYVVPIMNTPSGSYHMNIFLDNDTNFAKNSGDLFAE